MRTKRGGQHRSLVLAFLLACGSSASSAHAQGDAPIADANVVLPPKLKTDSPATYPEQALKDNVRERVEVVLVLDIDAQGAVKNAVVDAPGEHGFDAAAIAAAKKLVFEPATRGGQPIAAKIRFKYVFEPPPAQIVGGSRGRRRTHRSRARRSRCAMRGVERMKRSRPPMAPTASRTFHSGR